MTWGAEENIHSTKRRKGAGCSLKDAKRAGKCRKTQPSRFRFGKLPCLKHLRTCLHHQLLEVLGSLEKGLGFRAIIFRNAPNEYSTDALI